MRYQNAFLGWLPLVVVISGMCLLVYATVQQNYRQSLNDPQIQIAEDTAARIKAGENLKSIIPLTVPQLDINASLSPWIAVYDTNGKPIAATGLLDGQLPQVPAGVLQSAQGVNGKDTDVQNENRVTWQPRENVRQAIVVDAVAGADSYVYVVSGRNMREVERREDQLSTFVILAWLAMMVATGILQVIPVYVSRR